MSGACPSPPAAAAGAVEACFGRVGGVLLAIVQYPNLFLTAIAYNITGANSITYFAYSYKSFADSSLCTGTNDAGGAQPRPRVLLTLALARPGRDGRQRPLVSRKGFWCF